ncbi:MAG: hypothetical protein AMXMBFR58_16650 [Phycisphaerae bacterium]
MPRRISSRTAEDRSAAWMVAPFPPEMVLYAKVGIENVQTEELRDKPSRSAAAGSRERDLLRVLRGLEHFLDGRQAL